MIYKLSYIIMKSPIFQPRTSDLLNILDFLSFKGTPFVSDLPAAGWAKFAGSSPPEADRG